MFPHFSVYYINYIQPKRDTKRFVVTMPGLRLPQPLCVAYVCIYGLYVHNTEKNIVCAMSVSHEKCV